MANVKSVLAASAAALTALVLSAGCSTSVPPALCASGVMCPEGTQCAAHSPQCISGLCGNGAIDADEICDDGGIVDGDVIPGEKPCNSTCTSDETCHNGIRDIGTGEACDCKIDPVLGKVCDPPAATNCSDDCMSGGLCGNGVPDPTEQCDQGANGRPAWGSTCNFDCTTSRCGDGKTNTAAHEACDGGSLTATDGISPTCNRDCSSSVCGDGRVNPLDARTAPAGEQCDDANNNAWTAACLPNCMKNVCGDGHRNVSSKGYEDCDSGPADATMKVDCPYSPNQTSCTLCSQCKLTQGVTHFCGDGKPDPAEACDHGPLNGDVNVVVNCVYGEATCELCSRTCTARTVAGPLCGDSVVNGATLADGGIFWEQCDNSYSFACGTCSAPGTVNACTSVAPAKAAGRITVVSTVGLAGVTVAVADDLHRSPQVFEFVAAGGTPHGANIPIAITASDVYATAQAAGAAIGGATSIDLSATANGSSVRLTNDVAGVDGNAPITLGNNGAGALSATPMTGGIGCRTNDRCGASADCVSGQCRNGLCI